MVCTVVPMPNGGRAIVCGPAARCKCGHRATLLCDWKVKENASGTCDAKLCKKMHDITRARQRPVPGPCGRVEISPGGESMTPVLVFTLQDIIGISVVGILLVCAAVILVWALIVDAWRNFKRRFFKRRDL